MTAAPATPATPAAWIVRMGDGHEALFRDQARALQYAASARAVLEALYTLDAARELIAREPAPAATTRQEPTP